ncbi:MAG: transcription-repair coupling factor [Ignavibacteriae bacterium]|nr:transcription-repair coupling factor [Ignavibacteriota bacterium]NOG98421.1 transcription-repair coupling factor [Ignavibacteriota bacterium]
MKSLVLNKFESLESFNHLINEIEKKEHPSNKIYVSPLHGSTKSLFLNRLIKSNSQILLLSPTIKEVNETKVEMDVLGLSDNTIAIDKLTNDSLQESLTDLNSRDKVILLSTYDILKVKLPSKENVENTTTRLEVGSEITYDEVIEYMSMLNYNREQFVGSPGEFAVRGSIIDFWSYSEKQPCRIEYDGDFLESIRYFDVDSQRSSGREQSATLASSISEGDVEYTSTIFDYLNKPLVFASEFEMQKLSLKEEKIHAAAAEIIPDDIDNELKEELYETENEPAAVEEIGNGKPEFEDEFNPESLFQTDALWVIEDELQSNENVIRLGYNEAPTINSNFELLFNVLTQYAKSSFDVIISAENEMQAKRLFELLSDFKPELRELLEIGKIKTAVLAIKEGFLSKKEKLLIISDYQIFNKPYRTKISRRQKYNKSRVKDFASIKKGDFVVHETFGIGQYVGLETIKIGLVEQESIKILYAEGGVVYVNLNYLGLVKKFASKENAAPRLSTLGSNEWKSTKKKVKTKIKEAARELISLYAKRKATKGISYSEDTIWQKELEASFFYEDTPDQSKVSEDVKSDMETENPMDRLVCGDVGFGKTEIAVRAAFKAVNDGKQVALLVPTTILAEQHYNTFKDRLSQFPVKVAAISRFQTKAQQTEILAHMTAGTVDIIIGTHRLLSKDIKFKDLGLLIIDEEHRFGVMAKEKLRAIKLNVDTLTLTATPIPRTLNLSLLGARDLSIIATPPPNRQPIYTKVDKFDIVKIREWIMEEIKRGGQIYFVHDRVQSIDKIADYLQKHIPEINIGVAHGQMKPSLLEKVIHDFLNKKFHVLISTKIIESGLDIPNVNTIIINRADRFGLAELHQLRGRVGRSDKQAYAYLLVPSMNTVTKKAVRRLQAIEEYTDLGEGFNLSMRDLEIRGAGNLLGTEQSGAIDSVGFDLYVKMLDEAVDELKHAEFKDVFKDLPKVMERSEPTVDTFFEINIPQSYMPDQSDRLSFYSAMFSMIKIEELDEIKEEMEDRFGKVPVIIERLMSIAVLRLYASIALFERIVITRDKISFLLPKPEREEFYTKSFSKLMQYVVEYYPNDIQFKQDKNVAKLLMKNDFQSPEAAVKFCTEFCKKVIEVVA